MGRAPQFFEASAEPQDAPSELAVYRVKTRKGSAARVVVQCVDRGGNVPRDATSFKKLVDDLDLNKELKQISGVASAVIDALSAIGPDAIEVEFGVELGGELGLPLVTKGSAKANFKVTLKWENGSSSGKKP
jgi:Trypsin-co-occurring domain 1